MARQFLDDLDESRAIIVSRFGTPSVKSRDLRLMGGLPGKPWGFDVEIVDGNSADKIARIFSYRDGVGDFPISVSTNERIFKGPPQRRTVKEIHSRLESVAENIAEGYNLATGSKLRVFYI
jgi:hypothetical protein